MGNSNGNKKCRYINIVKISHFQRISTYVENSLYCFRRFFFNVWTQWYYGISNICFEAVGRKDGKLWGRCWLEGIWHFRSGHFESWLWVPPSREPLTNTSAISGGPQPRLVKGDPGTACRRRDRFIPPLLLGTLTPRFLPTSNKF